MKNKLVFFYGFFCILSVILAILAFNKWDKAVKIYNEEQEKEEKIEEIKEYYTNLPIKTIKLKISSTGEVKEMDINDYLIRSCSFRNATIS